MSNALYRKAMVNVRIKELIKTSKQRKILSEMEIKIKLCNTKNI